MVAASLLFSWVPIAYGQEAGAPVTLHSDAKQVLVDVVVTEKSRGVRGIERGRFKVFEDGKERPVSSFEEHAGGATSIRKAAPLPPHTYSDAAAYPAGAAVNILLIDGLNTPMTDQVRMRQQMLEYVGKLPAGTPMAVFTLASRLRMLSGFTTEPGALAAALEGKSGSALPSVLLEASNDHISVANQMVNMKSSDSPASAAAQFVADRAAFATDVRVRMTLDAIEELARYLSALPGRKNLIWFSGSFPIALDADNSLTESFNAMRSYGDEVKATDQLLASARIAVYPVDARGLRNMSGFSATYRTPALGATNPASGMGSPVEAENKQFMASEMNERATMEDVASDTGGRAFLNSNDLTGALAKAVEDGSSYYTLSYAPGSTKADGKYHKIKVEVEGGSYQLSYRRGYFADERDRGRGAEMGKEKKERVDQETGAAGGVLAAAIERGAPPSTQIFFHARVLPASDAEFKGDGQILSAPGGEMSAGMHGAKQRYVVDMRVDVATLRFDAGDGGLREAKMEMALVAYDADGKRLNVVDRTFPLSLTAEAYQQLRAPGLAVRSLIDLPVGDVFLRVVVRELGVERVGSVEVPLVVAE